MTKVRRLKWGADPEFFVSAREELSVLPPVFFRTDLECPYQENDRHPIFFKHDGTVVHEDGAAFEMSTPPSNNWRDVWDNIESTRLCFGEYLEERYSDSCIPELKALPAMKWDVKKWARRGADFELATIFGCDPDQSALNIEAQCQVMDASRHPWRYGGGHVHVSGLPEIGKNPLTAVKCMIMTAGLAATAFSRVPDLERERLFLYGKPDKFRVQHYKKDQVVGAADTGSDVEVGIEYRTPSNSWTGDLNLATQVFTWAGIGMEVLLAKKLYHKVYKEILPEAVKAILNVDQALAEDLLDRIESYV
jgi:hypothetical protein